MKLKLKKLGKVRSTNEEAIKLITNNKINPTIITATNQTKGKGTMGKKWISKKGNLFVSIFFDISDIKITSANYSILNPYIIMNILRKYSKEKIYIKWPNDILIKGRKLCGILQEIIEFKNKKYLIIGIGINTLVSPAGKDFKSVSLLNCSNKIIRNNIILKDIKLAYEIFISDINKYKISYLKKKICKA